MPKTTQELRARHFHQCVNNIMRLYESLEKLSYKYPDESTKPAQMINEIFKLAVKIDDKLDEFNELYIHNKKV